jgi:hypothetical protein
MTAPKVLRASFDPTFPLHTALKGPSQDPSTFKGLYQLKISEISISDSPADHWIDAVR